MLGGAHLDLGFASYRFALLGQFLDLLALAKTVIVFDHVESLPRGGIPPADPARVIGLKINRLQ